ncbi:DUF819 family protein [Alkaliflexus imshenetskii]|uniref:DUF819 family protein n=1 Tax=Alkaliflexus imshenetskii TaxID=286730 RepID=UPI001F251765|nr:DUF819 family protein [Alkaliflexus imshenetskii]
MLLILFYFLAPILVLFLCHRFKSLEKIGAVVVAYALGLILANTGLIPAGGAAVQNLIISVTIPLAIPLMLFSTNLKEVSKLARKSFFSLMIGIASVTMMITAGYFIFREAIPEAWKVGGLLVGVYTGGTPNLAALKMILDVDESLYLVTHSADLLVGVFYLMFLVSLGQKVFAKVLRPSISETSAQAEQTNDTSDHYAELLKKVNIPPLLKALLAAILVVGASVAVSLLVPESMQMAIIMLLITTLSLTLSITPKINATPRTFEFGMYFVLVFSIVVASMANVQILMTAALEVILYVAWVVFGSLVVQVILSKLFKIDTDTVIITSTALICSPPFVPVVAGALKNRQLIVPGLTIGIIGFALGNYLGFIMAQLLKMIGN